MGWGREGGGENIVEREFVEKGEGVGCGYFESYWEKWWGGSGGVGVGGIVGEVRAEGVSDGVVVFDCNLDNEYFLCCYKCVGYNLGRRLGMVSWLL